MRSIVVALMLSFFAASLVYSLIARNFDGVSLLMFVIGIAFLIADIWIETREDRKS